MATVAELAEQGWAEELLLSEQSHVKVAQQLGVSEKSVRRWRNKNSLGQGPLELGCATPAPVTFSTSDREALHGKLDELIDETNADPGSVKGMRVATWDTMHKDEDGEAVVTRMYGVRLESARWAPSWPVVQPAAPVDIHYSPKPRGQRTDERVAVILPDTQIGYRYYADTDEYDPFHDNDAIEVALEIVERVQPDEIILLGDYLDLPQFGTYEQEATFARTTQRAVDYGYKLLSLLRGIVGPGCKIVMLEGNHDRRLEKMVTRNAMEAFGLRRADDITGWPVLSLPHLLRLGELGVDYIGGYPAGSYWINDRLKCIHGSIVRSGGSTARAVADAERVSVIFGHIHRVETQYRTADVREGGRTRLAHTPGCLCRIDGAVPSVKGSTDLAGRPVTHYEDWQQGLSIITYQPGDGPFSLESVFINTLEGHRAVYNGEIYTPSGDMIIYDGQR